MNTFNLRAFIEIVERGSLSAAARELSMTQPGVSMLLRRLERHYGVQLVERRHLAIETTSAGEALYKYARRVMSAERQLDRELEVARDRRRGRVRVGSTRAIGGHFLPPIISQFKTAYPKARVSMEIGTLDEVRQLVLEGRVDFAYTARQEHEDLVSTLVHRERMLLVAAAGDTLANRIVSPSELMSGPFVTLDRNSGLRRRLEKALGDLPATQLNVAVEVADADALKEAVQCGLGYALVPESLVARELRQGLICEIVVQGFAIAEDFCLVRRKQPAPTPTAAALYTSILNTQAIASDHEPEPTHAA
jgi:DNA-binding transcriptional LysR family regulator